MNWGVSWAKKIAIQSQKAEFISLPPQMEAADFHWRFGQIGEKVNRSDRTQAVSILVT
jgi:hypothetical protein